MKDLNNYLKYYFLEEKYLFSEVNKNFHERGYLIPKELFAIVFWKRKPAAFQIVPAWSGKSVEGITKEVYAAKDNKKKQLALVLNIKEVGIAIASAILTVCYPEEFTVLDYHALNSLRKIKREEYKSLHLPLKSEDFKEKDYFVYLDLCKKISKELNISLRNLDRILWAMDWYEGKNGLKEIVELYLKNLKR